MTRRDPLIALDGQVYDRVPVGESAHECIRDDGACCGCGRTRGDLHADGCDWERCPHCGSQMICCDCNDEEMPRYSPRDAILTANLLLTAAIGEIDVNSIVVPPADAADPEEG